MAPSSPLYPEEKSPDHQVTEIELQLFLDGLIPVLKEAPSDHPEAVVEHPQVAYGSGLEWVPRLEYNVRIADKPVEVVKKEPFWGLGKKRFWILVGVAVVVVLAALGGGVGGAMAAKGGEKVVNGTATARYVLLLGRMGRGRTDSEAVVLPMASNPQLLNLPLPPPSERPQHPPDVREHQHPRRPRTSRSLSSRASTSQVRPKNIQLMGPSK